MVIETCPEDSQQFHPTNNGILGDLHGVTSLKDLHSESEMTLTFLMDKLSRIDKIHRRMVNRYAKIHDYRSKFIMAVRQYQVQ